MRKTIFIASIVLLSIIMICTLCMAEEADYYDWKGLKSCSAKNYSGSIAYFDQSIEMDPTYIDAWVHKGDALKAMKDYNGSVDSYLSALQ